MLKRCQQPFLRPGELTVWKSILQMEFVQVPKGVPWLGSGGGQPGNEKVELKHDFYLGKYEVTQAEWAKVTGSNPSSFKGVPGVPPEDQAPRHLALAYGWLSD